MKLYDSNKIRELILKYENNGLHGEKLISAVLGMQNDWLWTAGTVYRNGKHEIDIPQYTNIPTINEFLRDRMKLGTLGAVRKYRNDICFIGGLCGSDIDIPTLELTFSDDCIMRFSVFIEHEVSGEEPCD